MPLNRDHLEIIPQPELNIHEFDIPARDGHSICVRAYKQSGQTDLPLLIYLHGGVDLLKEALKQTMPHVVRWQRRFPFLY